jgi:TATA-binding protein-associated factor
LLSQILPYLHSKSHETRSAASNALSQIFSLVPVWQPQAVDIEPPPDLNTFSPDFPAFSVQELMQKGVLLLASSGKEFSKPTGILANAAEVKRARKEAMGRLGLDFLESVGATDDMDLDKELAIEGETETDHDSEIYPKREDTATPIDSPMEVEASVKRERSPPPSLSRPKSATPAAPSPVTEGECLNGLSARERNRLKRKRKPGNSAFVAAPPPPPAGAKYSATPAGPSNK